MLSYAKSAVGLTRVLRMVFAMVMIQRWFSRQSRRLCVVSVDPTAVCCSVSARNWTTKLHGPTLDKDPNKRNIALHMSESKREGGDS